MRKLGILGAITLLASLSAPALALDLSTAVITDSITSLNLRAEGMTWDGSYLWVTNAYDNTFVKVSPITKSIVKTIPGFSAAEGLAWDGSYLWTFDNNNQNLIEINPDNGAILYSVNVGRGGRGGLTYDGHYFWKADRPEYLTIDPSTGGIVDTISSIDLPGIEEGLAYDGTYLYNIAFTNTIYRIDPITEAVLDSFLLSPGAYNGLTFDGQSLWAADYGNQTLYKISSAPVPEPGSLLLLGSGLIGLVGCRRNFKKYVSLWLHSSKEMTR